MIYQDILCLFHCVEFKTDGANTTTAAAALVLVVFISSWPQTHIKKKEEKKKASSFKNVLGKTVKTGFDYS